MAALEEKRLQALAIGFALTVVPGLAAAAPQDWPATVNRPPVARILVMQAEARAQEILDRLTLDQKIGQMTQGEIQTVTPAHVAQYCLGSVLNGGGSWPNSDKYASPQDWRDLADAYWQAGMDGCGIPPLWGTDSVHGNSNVIGATLFPHNIGLGAANNPRLMRSIGAATAAETRATGQPWVFAPTVAVARDDRWGRTYESYSEDPRRVTSLARPLIEGLQGNLGECNVAATAKHWIGDGGTTQGQDQGDTEVPEEDLINIHGPVYFDALDAGVLSVMPSFSSWNGEKVHGNRYLITEILKGRLGFSGHVISDWNGHGQVTDCSNTDCPQAVDAGIDLMMVPFDWLEYLETTKQQVASGVIPMARVDDAVKRILRNKILLGLFEEKPSDSRCAVDSQLGTEKHRDLARAAVRQSLVLLKNNDGILPLSRDARILVTGKSAHNIAFQSGGWTLTWQGTGNTNADFPGATSIYDGIREIAPLADLSPTLTGVDLTQYDTVIAVIGERPYAEGLGDINSSQTLEHAKLNPDDFWLLQILENADVPVVTVWVAGRPLHTNKELNRSDAFVAAWLPGSEGGGIADVLFASESGKVNHDFTGTLPFSWPAEDCQTPLNVYEDSVGLFPFDYGLSYRDRIRLGQLDEASSEGGCVNTGGDTATEPMGVFINGGNTAPWQLRVADPSNWNGVSVDLSEPNNVTALMNIKAGPRVDSPTFQFGGITVSFGIDTAGVGPGQFYSQRSGGAGEDLRGYLNSPNGALVFDVRASTPPTSAVSTRIDCGFPCFGQLDLTPAYNSVSDGDWHELAVPLSCFASAGTNFGNVTTPFLVFTTGQWKADFATVRWEPDVVGNVTCGGVYHEEGRSGRLPPPDGSSDPIEVYLGIPQR